MKSILFFIFLLVSQFSFSQDTIVMRNKLTVLAKIIEINQDEVKYKRWEMQNGPDYSEQKSKINCIKYRNGMVDKMETIPPVSAGNDYVRPEQPAQITKPRKEKIIRPVTPFLRNAGIGLAAVGIGFIAIGTSMVNNANGVTSYSSQTVNGQTTTTGSQEGAFGALGRVGGTVAVLGGTTMIVFGQLKLNKQKRKRTAFLISPGSIYLAYTF